MKLYQELGLEALQQRQWYRKLSCFNKITSISLLLNLSDSISKLFQKYIFFWQLLSGTTLISKCKSLISIIIIKNSYLTFIQPVSNSIYICHDPLGLKLNSRLNLGLSNLREGKFKHSFKALLTHICGIGGLKPAVFTCSAVPVT